MTQKWYEVAIGKGDYKFITGIWADDYVDAKIKADWKFSLDYNCNAKVTDENGKESLKSDEFNNKFYVGVVDDILEKNEDMLTLEDLHKDNRLMIFDDFWLFTSQNDVEEVLHNYELDNDAVDIFRWFIEDPWSLFTNTVQDEIDNSSFADYLEVNLIFADKINNLSKKEMLVLVDNLEEMYITCAKENVLKNLKLEVSRLEEEWG